MAEARLQGHLDCVVQSGAGIGGASETVYPGFESPAALLFDFQRMELAFTLLAPKPRERAMPRHCGAVAVAYVRDAVP